MTQQDFVSGTITLILMAIFHYKSRRAHNLFRDSRRLTSRERAKIKSWFYACPKKVVPRKRFFLQ